MITNINEIAWAAASRGSWNETEIAAEENRAAIHQLFEALEKIQPDIDPVLGDRTWSFWLTIPRGSIDDWATLDAFLEYLDDPPDPDAAPDLEEADRRRREFWLFRYPEDPCFLPFFAARHPDGFLACSVGRSGTLFEFCPERQLHAQRTDAQNPEQVHELLLCLRDHILRIADSIDSYNAAIDTAVPIRCRKGWIARRDFEKAYPDMRAAIHEGLSDADIREIAASIGWQEGCELRKLPPIVGSPLPNLFAGAYLSACRIAYTAFGFDVSEPEDGALYRRYADGRDGGLLALDPEDPTAFMTWICDEGHCGGHPWEIAMGGNSTHISLSPVLEEDGWFFGIRGAAWTRCAETCRGYLALKRAGLPIRLDDGYLLVRRLYALDRVGIVPQGIVPAYCRGMFSDEIVIDYFNLHSDMGSRAVSRIHWYPEKKLIPASP